MDTPTHQQPHPYATNLLLVALQQISAQSFDEALYALETADLILRQWPDMPLQEKMQELRIQIPEHIQSTNEYCYALPTGTGLMCNCGAFAPYNCICTTPENLLDAEWMGKHGIE